MNATAVNSSMFAVAITAASVGVGLTLPHLSAEGLVLHSVLGAALLVAGLGAAVWSGWRLLSGLRHRGWMLAVPLMLVVAHVALWTVGQAVAASVPAHPALGDRTPGDLGLVYRDVQLRTSDGVRLAAWWIPSRNGAAVALLHGAGSTRTAVLDEAAVLARHRYGVLLVDARGHGGSGGIGMDFGWYGERDAAAAVDFLSDRPGVFPARIGLVGLSMGGEEAIGVAGLDGRVHAVVAEGATNRVAADKAYLAAYGVRGQLQRGIDWLTYATAGLLTRAPEPAPLRDSVAAAAHHGTRLLLVTAGDVETEQLAAAHLREAAPSAVEIWTVPGAGHVQGLRTAPHEWEHRVVTFLDTTLLSERIPSEESS